MTAQTHTPDIAAASAPNQAVNRTALTCTWVTADDGALAMQWTGQTFGDEREEMTKAAA